MFSDPAFPLRHMTEERSGQPLPTRSSSKVGTWFRAGISILLIVFLFSFIDVGEVAEVLLTTNCSLLAIVLMLMLLDRALMAYKWTLLTEAKQVSLGFLGALKIYLISGFVGIALPTGVGADLYRIYRTSRLTGRTHDIVGSVVIERFLGLVASMVFAVFGLVVMTAVSPEFAATKGFIAQMLVVLILLTILFLLSMQDGTYRVFRKLLHRLHAKMLVERLLSFHEAYIEFSKSRGALLGFFLLTALEQGLYVIIVLVTALAINAEMGAVYFLGLVPLCQIIKRLPISINAIGVQEGLFVYFFGQAGMPAHEALSLSLLIRIAQWSIVLLGGLLYATSNDKRPELGVLSKP